ncbi:MAG: TetR/AcrR family transcriptional regulator [Planctomycetota bacterium]
MSVKRAASGIGTKQRILEVATGLMQARGFHGFTFHDVAAELGISHVAVHHHYKTKAALVEAAMLAYTERFSAELEQIAASGEQPEDQLRSYAALFDAVVQSGDRVCLCGVLAAELATLPAPVQPAVRAFYDANEAWLARVIGRHVGKRSSSARVQQMAKAFLSLLEGAMISARAFGDPARLSSAAQWWIDTLPAA